MKMMLLVRLKTLKCSFSVNRLMNDAALGQTNWKSSAAAAADTKNC